MSGNSKSVVNGNRTGNVVNGGLDQLRPNPHWAKLPLFESNGWKTITFDEFAESVNERVEPANAAEEIYVGLDNLDSGSLHIRRWGKGSDVIGTKLRFRKGDIIFGRRRAYQRKLAVAEMDGICSAHAMVVRARPGVVLPEFLPFLMMSDRFMHRAVEISVGSLSPTINWTTLKHEPFALPSLDQQRRITEILWAVDEVLERTFTALQAAQTYKAAILDDQFASEHSKRLRLAELCGSKGIRIGPFGSQLHAHEYIENGIPVVMPANLDSDEIVPGELKRIPADKANELAVHKLEEGDVLLPRRGDLKKRGFVHVGQSGWICGTGTIRIRLDEANKRRLLFYALSRPAVSAWLQRNAVGTTMPNLNSTIVGNIGVFWPEDPAQAQQLIVQADAAIKAIQNQIGASKQLLAAIANQES